MRDQVKRKPTFTLLDLDEEKRRQQNTAKSLGLADGVRVSGATGTKEKESVIGGTASVTANDNNSTESVLLKSVNTTTAAVVTEKKKEVVVAVKKVEEEEESYFDSDYGNMGPMLM